MIQKDAIYLIGKCTIHLNGDFSFFEAANNLKQSIDELTAIKDLTDQLSNLSDCKADSRRSKIRGDYVFGISVLARSFKPFDCITCSLTQITGLTSRDSRHSKRATCVEPTTYLIDTAVAI
eukprot:Gregarina_sp_Poly_1__4668@NODE_2494_length_2063_cov_7_575150_g1584_i0_p2_GENE_NODE_2494_length_2063_cov_7_575150_g1584_i0NODE_2494_length_2063_cov_7_575150_g1584_i0_p2_ORF_typecomplete_len121_score11_65_NODE_2494_length_2063_cov_7_575150_g1584_i015681930